MRTAKSDEGPSSLNRDRGEHGEDVSKVGFGILTTLKAVSLVVCLRYFPGRDTSTFNTVLPPRHTLTSSKEVYDISATESNNLYVQSFERGISHDEPVYLTFARVMMRLLSDGLDCY